MDHETWALFQGENITINGGNNQTTLAQQYEGQPTYPISYGSRHIQYKHPHNVHEPGAGISALQKHISPRAFATQQEGEAPKCHPNTRVAVLNEIMTWILLAAADRITWILWVFGAAGAGKSAIARSIVDGCLKRADVIIARFFFFRADGTRNTLNHVVATIAYQLIQSLPELDTIILDKIRSHPRIFNDSLEAQLRWLILEPLSHLHSISPITKAIAILFDGVDECKGGVKQRMLIKTLHEIFSSRLVPVTLLFFSRPEVEIRAEFRSRKMASLTKHLELDYNYQPDEDIKRYLEDSFQDIREDHPFRHLIPENWPSPQSIDEIVLKSSGQFIFASVVVNFISAARVNPVQMLDIILGIQPSGHLTPFAQLDALYRYVFSQVANLDRVLLILAAYILQSGGDSYTSLGLSAAILDVAVGEIEIALADLMSVVRCKNRDLQFLHASLSDFLLDHDRSGAFYIDRTVWSTRLSLICLGVPERPRKTYSIWCVNYYIMAAEPSTELRQAVLNARYDEEIYEPSCEHSVFYLSLLKAFDFGDGGETYQRICDNFIMHIAENYQDSTDDFLPHKMSSHSTRQFIINGFAAIKQTHQFNFLLPDDWPDKEAVDEIIANSAGLFLYVYLAMQEISSPRRHPAIQLEAIRGIRASTGDLSQFGPLDALYRHMLSQVFDLDRTHLLLTPITLQRGFLHNNLNIKSLMQLHDFSLDEIQYYRGELTAILFWDDNNTCHVRESFREFLLDERRSCQYYADQRRWANRLLMIHLSNKEPPDLDLLVSLLKLATPTPELRQAILNPHNEVCGSGKDLGWYLIAIRRLNFGDGRYRQKLDYFTRWIHANRPLEELVDFRTYHDIDDILASISREAAQDQLFQQQSESRTSGTLPEFETSLTPAPATESPIETGEKKSLTPDSIPTTEAESRGNRSKLFSNNGAESEGSDLMSYAAAALEADIDSEHRPEKQQHQQQPQGRVPFSGFPAPSVFSSDASSSSRPGTCQPLSAVVYASLRSQPLGIRTGHTYLPLASFPFLFPFPGPFAFRRSGTFFNDPPPGSSSGANVASGIGLPSFRVASSSGHFGEYGASGDEVQL